MRLTEIVIKNFRPPTSGQVTYTDDSLPGFGVRVSCGGVKTFVLVYGRNRKRVTVGRYPIIGLSDARAKAKEMLAERMLGKHDAPAINFDDAVELFLSTHYRADSLKPRTKLDTKNYFERHFIKSLRYERVTDIHTRMVSAIIDRLQDTPVEAHQAFARMRFFCNWAVRRGHLDRSPCAGLQPPPLPLARDRVLSSDELKYALKHVREGYTSHDRIVELLILTGQRKTEIGSLQAEWIDFEKRTTILRRPHR